MTAPAKIDRLMPVQATGFVLSCRAGKAEDIVKTYKNNNNKGKVQAEA